MMGLAYAGGQNGLPTAEELEAQRQAEHERQMAELRRREALARRRIQEAADKIKKIEKERGPLPDRSGKIKLMFSFSFFS